jgi:hypothetical protein
MLQAAAAAAAGVGVPSTGIQWGVLWRAAQHLSQNLRSEVQNPLLGGYIRLSMLQLCTADCPPSATTMHSSEPHCVLLQVQIREIPNLLTQSSSSCQQLHPFLPSQLTSISPYSSTSKTSVHEPVNAEFTYACKQLKTAATQDTTWDRRIHDAVAHINQQLGGFWLLVECGTFPDNHLLAGRPARALLHASMWCVQRYELSDIPATALSDSVSTSSTSSSSGTSSSLDSNASSSSASSSSRPRGRPPGPNSKRKVVFDLKLLKAPVKQGDMPGLSEFHVHYAAYQLDAEGWPTGKLLAVFCASLYW